MFEIIKSDLAGRIGILHTRKGKVETPAFVPVIHPVRQTISPQFMKKLGFNLVITNAYITLNNYGEEAKRRGIHSIINFDGTIMTDSGGYQVLEYGDVRVSPDKIAEYQTQIGSDISIPLDKPTGFGLPKKKANEFVKHTLEVSKKTLQKSIQNGQIWVGPIQGGEHFDLVRKSTKSLIGFGFPMLALGSPVEFMESYEFKLLAQMILEAKKQIPSSIPLHLFGAGHPLAIPIAVALGCDTFDSASYMLYAKNDRYISEDRTYHLSKINQFYCSCNVCSDFSPKELQDLQITERINKLALHNLFAIKAEVDRVKQAIFEGRLWEYVLKKARSHPKLYEATEVFTKNWSFFLKTTPKFNESAIFLFSYEDQFRPEVQKFHKIVENFKSGKKILVFCPEPTIKPLYLSREYSTLKEKFEQDKTQFCTFNPFLGIVPLEISDLFPASHYLMSRQKFEPEFFSTYSKSWNLFFQKNKFLEIHYKREDLFLKFFIKKLPKNVRRKFLREK